MIRHDRTRGVSARSVLMADVKDANATPDTVSVSLHDNERDRGLFVSGTRHMLIYAAL